MKEDIKTESSNRPQQPGLPQSGPMKAIDGISQPVVTNQSPQPSAKLPEPSPSATEQPNSHPAQSHKNSPPSKPKKKSSAMPIILAVIILLALSSLAIYVGLIRKDGSNDSNKNTSSQQLTEDHSAQDEQEIKQTIEQIDALPDETDTSGDNLSDQKLGL